MVVCLELDAYDLHAVLYARSEIDELTDNGDNM